MKDPKEIAEAEKAAERATEIRAQATICLGPEEVKPSNAGWCHFCQRVLPCGAKFTRASMRSQAGITVSFFLCGQCRDEEIRAIRRSTR